MTFLFGTKYPIFNEEGEIAHKRDKSFKKWKEKYLKDSNKNWRYHDGMSFKEENPSQHK